MKKKTYKIFMRMILILVTLIILIGLCHILFPSKEIECVINGIEEKEIVLEAGNYKINIDYPLYNKENIDKIIEEYLELRINEITESEMVNSLNIDYEIYSIDEYNYLVFDIKSSLDENLRYKTFLIDEKTEKIISYDKIFDIEKIKSKTIDYLSTKYSESILEGIEGTNFNFLDYLINNEGIRIYFNELKTSKMSYIPNIFIKKENLKNILKVDYDISKEYTFKEIVYDKVIALTFDDGPSDVTTDILDVLESYNAHATFFSLGNRMKLYKNTLQKEVKNGHEVSSHTYSHKDLSSLKENEILKQINTTNTLFNTLTSEHIKYVRPPYGNYNSEVLSVVEYPLILWNIDTKDWYYLDAEKTANTVIKKAFNGGIVLMHDLYSSNVEALKIMLPELEAKGYKFVTITEMAENFEVTLEKGKAYRYIE